jgi:type I restriction enzyme S subunit
MSMISFYKETDFKETPIGKIPRDWQVKKLKDVCNKITDGTHKTPKYVNKGIPFLSSKNIIPFRKGFDFSEYEKYISPEEHKELIKRCEPEKGDILISKCGTIGRAKLVDVDYEFSIFVGLALLKLREGLVKGEYLEQLLNYEPLRIRMEISSPGSTRKTLTIGAIERLHIPLPSLLEEQQKIALILSTVDEAIQKTNEIIAKTGRLKKGLMQELLTKGIGHREFKDTEIGRIPREWGVVGLGDIAEVESGFGFPREYQGRNTGKYPFIKVNDLNLSSKYIFSAENFVDDEDLKLLKAKVFPPNTILFPKIGMATYLNKFRILKVWGTFDNNVAGVVSTKIEPEFLFYYFSGKIDLKQLSGRTTAPSIRKTTLRSILIPFPPLPEQRRIAEILSTVDQKLEIERNEKARLERIKQGLMDLLLTGKIRLR